MIRVRARFVMKSLSLVILVLAACMVVAIPTYDGDNEDVWHAEHSLELLAMPNTLHTKSLAEKQLVIKGIETTLDALHVNPNRKARLIRKLHRTPPS